MPNDSTKYEWNTELLIIGEDIQPSKPTKLDASRIKRSIVDEELFIVDQRKMISTKSKKFIEKLQKDRERDEEIHNKCLKVIPRQLRSPSRQKCVFYKVDGTKEKSVSRARSVYLRHGHVPPIHRSYRKISRDGTENYFVEPLAIDRKMVVSLTKASTPLDSTRSLPPLSNSKTTRRLQVIPKSDSRDFVHDRPAKLSKSLERLNFILPMLPGRRVEKDGDNRSNLIDIETNTTMSAIRSVQEYNEPGTRDVSPETAITVGDVFNIRPN